MYKQIIVLACSFLFTIFQIATAQPFNLKKEIKPVELNFVNFSPKDAKAKGRINVTKVVQVKDTAYYFCKKLSIYSPIVVSLGVQDSSKPVQVSLHKWNWKQTSRDARTTNEKGYWEEKFSTEADFGIMVVAPHKPSVYNIYVWVGDEVKLKIPTPFKPNTAPAASAGGGNGGGLFSVKNIIIGLVALLLIAFGYFMIKKKNKMKGTIILLLMVMLPTVFSFAQNTIADDIDSEIDFPDPGGVPLNGNDFVSQNSGRPAIVQGDHGGYMRAFAAIEQMDFWVGTFTTVANIIQTGGDVWAAANILDNGECTPDFSQPVSALVPSSCNDPFDPSGCFTCYNDALEPFSEDRQTLARMWCIYMNTKNFNDKAIAFGNAMASLPGGVGLGWIPAKQRIDGAYTTFKGTFDRKSRELLTSLQKNMMKINDCENQFGIADWYQRFGFMYFEFMQQKYKRLD
jgi:hypothetical protein